MEYSTLTPEVREPQVLEPKQSHSLYEICQQVVDGRAARGKQYDLAGLLVVLVMAKLAGMKSLLGASDWVRDQQTLLCEQLKLSWRRMPCANTYKYALARLDRKPGERPACSLVGTKGGRKAAVERNPAVWRPNPANGAFTWRLMGKFSKGPGIRCMGERSHRSMCCMSMRYKRGLSCTNVPLLRSAMR